MYTPDKWIVLKIKDEKSVIYRVLAGWSGGYLEGQSWKINSGIVEIKEDGDYYLFYGHSGSIYQCHKKGYGTNRISSEILEKILSDPKFKNNVDVVSDQDFCQLKIE